MSVKIQRKDLDTFIGLFIMILGFIFIAWIATFGNGGVVLSVAFFFLIILLPIYKCVRKSELTVTLILPIVLSALQNVYLGFFSPELTSSSVQFLTVLNFLFISILFGVLMTRNRSILKKNNLGIIFLSLILYSIFSVILLPRFNILSIISSFRNIVSAFLFFFVGAMAAGRLNIGRFQKMLIILGLIVVLVGYYDIVTGGQMWRNLNITDLWNKKGINVQASGLPTNFYSSEKINGQRIRRMASTFADPVNLGAFLFATYCITWFRKNRIINLMILVAIFFTVSKGAFLGLLIFISVYAFYNSSRESFSLILCGVGAIGGLFLIMAYKTSANSVFVHISGLVTAFRSMFNRPLGYGIGSNGVLAGQFSKYYANEGVTETGIGMIISQLGLPGFILFVFFFTAIIKECTHIINTREKVLCLSLAFSIIGNMFFNEVALSPNSCGIYFLILGYYISSNLTLGDNTNEILERKI